MGNRTRDLSAIVNDSHDDHYTYDDLNRLVSVQRDATPNYEIRKYDGVGRVVFSKSVVASNDPNQPKAFGRQAFRKYLKCGIFARARCGDCGHDYFVAFSCKGCGVCPSCNTRRMADTAAHLTEHVFPSLPVRQWVLSVPKRLRYFMQRDGAVLNSLAMPRWNSSHRHEPVLLENLDWYVCVLEAAHNPHSA